MEGGQVVYKTLISHQVLARSLISRFNAGLSSRSGLVQVWEKAWTWRDPWVTTTTSLALENFPPFQNRCRQKLDHPVWWAFPVLIYDEKSIFCNIASLQIFLWEVEMSQLVRRQVKPLISSDQVNSGRRDCLQFCVRMSVHVYRERPGWGCSPCTRPGGDTFPSCARTSTCPELRLSATQLSGQLEIYQLLMRCLSNH